MNPAGGEVWYSLSQVDNASEVHGQLHLKILATKHVRMRLELYTRSILLYHVIHPDVPTVNYHFTLSNPKHFG